MVGLVPSSLDSEPGECKSIAGKSRAERGKISPQKLHRGAGHAEAALLGASPKGCSPDFWGTIRSHGGLEPGSKG